MHKFSNPISKVFFVSALAALLGCSNPDKSPTITDATRVKLARALTGDAESGDSFKILDKSAILRQAKLLIDLGDVDHGLAVASEALATHGDDPAFAMEVARMADTAGHRAEAETIYRLVLKTHPDAVDALVGEGVVTAQKGDYPDAISKFRQALTRRPNDLPARNNLALALALAGQSQEAVSLLEQLNHEAGASDLTRGNLAYARLNTPQSVGSLVPSQTMVTAPKQAAGSTPPIKAVMPASMDSTGLPTKTAAIEPVRRSPIAAMPDSMHSPMATDGRKCAVCEDSRADRQSDTAADNKCAVGVNAAFPLVSSNP